MRSPEPRIRNSARVVLAALAFATVSAVVVTPVGAAIAISAKSVHHHVKPKVSLQNVAPSPNFLASCTSATVSSTCLTAELAAIDHGRAVEGRPPISINVAGFAALSPSEQVFALTNLERTSRALTPVSALTAQLDAVAEIGAANSVDPALVGWTLSGSRSVTAWGSNWAGGLDVVGADYFWMYDDGVGHNIGCPTSTAPGCWAHRDNILLAAPTASSCPSGSGTPELVMGAAVVPTAYQGTPGIAEVIVRTCGTPTDTIFTWRGAKRILFGSTA